MAETVIPDDSYFMMGDHRSISSDSREFGAVERELIYGKAVFVYWPARDVGVVQVGSRFSRIDADGETC